MPSNNNTKKDLASFLAPSSSITLARQQQQYGHSTTRSSSNTRKKSLQTIDNSPKMLSSATTSTTAVTLPKYGNLAISTGTTVKSVIRSDADHFPRGFAEPHSNPINVGGFQTTSRGGARLIALPELHTTSKSNNNNNNKNNNNSSSLMNNAVVMSSATAADTTSNNTSTIEERTPDVSMIQGPGSTNGEVKIRDICKFGLRTKAPLLTEIDPSQIGREQEQQQSQDDQAPSSNNKKIVKYVRIQPEFLNRGMVQPPQAEVVEVDPTILNDDATRLMNPRQRRELMEAQRKAREGLVALREVQAAKTKLSRTCQKLYPHGCLGCSDGPYAEDPDETAYRGLSTNLAAEATKVGRKGKKDAGNFARPHNTGDVILNRDIDTTNFFTGELDQTKTLKKDVKKDYVGLDPTRTGGLRTSGTCRPKDQLKMFAVGLQ